jgi:tyrosine-specific transport protein
MNMRLLLLLCCLLTCCISAAAFEPPRIIYSTTNASPNILWKRTVHVFLSSNNEDNHEGGDGSIAGASLLFAGTAVGAGMIALPAETLNAGFIPSISGLSVCWLFTYVTSMLTLEASWLACTQNEDESGDINNGGGFLSISKLSLGVTGEVITAALFWFLLTAIVVAYTAEGGQLIAQFAKEFTDTTTIISPTVGSLLFASCFASFAIAGTSRVDILNRVFVLGLVATFIVIVGTISPFVQVSNLVSQSDWTVVYPAGISIGILSFGAQNVVPTILQYLNYDPQKTQKAILIGSLIPLFLYTIWETVFLGIIDASTVDSNSMEVVNVLGQIGGTTMTDLVELFSICAIGSSMAGASVSLVDFFVDALGLLSKDGSTSKTEKMQAVHNNTVGTGTRTIAAIFALVPPVLISYAFPDVFLTALEEAGLLGGVSLYGILPALCLLSLRSADNSSETKAMPGRLGGGKATLFALLTISSALVLPEIVHVGRVVTDKLQ